MGGSAFDGLPGREKGDDGDYIPGAPGYDRELLELLVDSYLGKRHWGRKLKEYALEQVEMRRDAMKDPDELLSGMASLLSMQGMDRHHTRESCRLFYSTVQALYDAGWNDLTMDLTPLAGMMPEHVCRWHEGTPERPLSLRCILPPTREADKPDVVWAGEHVTHCKIRVSGTAEWAGCWSYDSEFVFERRIENLGWHSERCSYALDAEDIGIGRGAWKSVRDCYRLEATWQDGRATTWLDPDFFGRGNTLLIPDGEGSWKEVKP